MSAPIEPAPSRFTFGSPAGLPAGEEVVGVGADLAPATLLAAYRHGIFPMPLTGRGPMAWWSPDPRGVLDLDQLRVSRSLRTSCRRFEVRVDTAFDEVVEACADPRRPGGWIRRDIKDAYRELHRLGWAHSIEAWRDGALAGGLYGVAVGGLFAGESMFHRATDASKVALVALVERLRGATDADLVRDPAAPARLIDVQWATPHLVSLGVREVPRTTYLSRLAAALSLPHVSWS